MPSLTMPSLMTFLNSENNAAVFHCFMTYPVL
jgi:hypothetical protein